MASARPVVEGDDDPVFASDPGDSDLVAVLRLTHVPKFYRFIADLRKELGSPRPSVRR